MNDTTKHILQDSAYSTGLSVGSSLLGKAYIKKILNSPEDPGYKKLKSVARRLNTSVLDNGIFIGPEFMNPGPHFNPNGEPHVTITPKRLEAWKKRTGVDVSGMSPKLQDMTNEQLKETLRKVLEKKMRPGHVNMMGRLNSGLLAHELGHALGPLGRTGRGAKFFTNLYAASKIGNLGAGTVAGLALLGGDKVSDNTLRNIGIGGAIAGVPMLAEEIRASAVGSRLLKTIGKRGLRRAASFKGIPTYLLASATGFIPWAARKIRKGTSDK